MTMRNRRHFKATLIVLVALIIGACGEPPTKTSAPTKPAKGEAAAPFIDACTLLTKTEVESFLGQPIKEPVSERVRPGVESASCAWKPDLTPVQEYELKACSLFLSVTHQSWIKSLKDNSIKAYYDLTRNPPNLPRTNAVDLPDLGDLAFVTGGFLAFIKDGYYVSMSESCLDESKISGSNARVTPLARLAEGRLP